MIEPIPKPVPVHGASAHGAAIGDLHPDAVMVFVHEPALEQILDYSEQDPLRELGGFLVGGLHEDKRPYVEVRHFLPAVDVRSRSASLTFTHETWSRMNREVEATYSGELVVGWQHTHPDFGIFLSAYDLFIHRHFFSASWQIAMVVDPKRQEFGFFEWRNSEIVSCGFVCVRE